VSAAVISSPGAGATAAAPAEEARARPRQLAARFGAVALLLALDLWSKAAVFAWITSHPAGMRYDEHGHLRRPLVDGWLAFMLSRNPGMAWGFDKLPSWLLVFGRMAAAVFLAVLLVRTPPARRVLAAALALILAGALGNLYDNLFLAESGERFGRVRDFIDVYLPWGWHFPTFNVADSCITVGAALLFAVSLRPARSEAGAPLAEPTGG
jgi:signal peptidase II